MKGGGGGERGKGEMRRKLPMEQNRNLRDFTIYKNWIYSTDGKSNQWETIFHAIIVNNCFKIFKLDSYLPTYTKITIRLIRMLNVEKYSTKTWKIWEPIISCQD